MNTAIIKTVYSGGGNLGELIQIKKIGTSVIGKLLQDRTTGKNIIWASDSYQHLGDTYTRDKQIYVDQILNTGIIEPRILKAIEVQKERTKKNAEVFTPAWIVNKMNNYADAEWFVEGSGFNIEKDQSWTARREHIQFSKRVDWKKYVKNKVLEITCGEAPFVVSRYDSSTGESIAVEDRIGIFDRKLRVVTENTDNFEDWYTWAITALKSTYGYEFQGDSLLVGRINVYMTFIETMAAVWEREIDLKQINQITDIITWNFWQMDGLTDCIPVGIPEERVQQPTLFDLFDFDDGVEEENAPTAKAVHIRWWDGKKDFELREMKEGIGMKKPRWGVILGNPPYQESDGGNKASAVAVYQKFIQAAEELQPNILAMIVPDRWFSGGRGLDSFREKMKDDRHIKYLYDFANANTCFPGVDISGGICYFIRDANYHGPCKFINHENANHFVQRYLDEFPVVIRSNIAVPILQKVNNTHIPSLSEKVSRQKPFGLRTYVTPSQTGELILRWNKGKGPIQRDQVTAGVDMIDQYKVIVSRVFFEHAGQANKDGQYRVLSILEKLDPNEVCTETYVVVDHFMHDQEAKYLIKYLKTKFARYLILQAASSIMITRNSFVFVPDMISAADVHINWDSSVEEIDQQLFEYFELNDDQRNVIKSTIKEME